jgi:hypothetical protein
MIWGALIIAAFIASVVLAFISWFMAGAPWSAALFAGMVVVLGMLMNGINKERRA